MTQGRYNPSVHAVERIREYFGIMEEGAKSFINEAMRKAKYVTTQRDGNLVYKYEDKDAMIVVDAKTNVIITVLPPSGKGKRNGTSEGFRPLDVSNEILAAAHTTIKRELAKARRQFTREYRMLTEEIAVIGLEIAQLSLNKARARSPITQQHITDKVSEIHARQTQLAEQRKQLKAEYRSTKTEAQAFLGTEE